MLKILKNILNKILTEVTIMNEPTIQAKGFECIACAGCVVAAAYVVAVGGASFANFAS